jgi:putative ABC transport system ATP-binding protein
MTVIELRDIAKSYPTPHGEFHALTGVNLTIGAGELVAVIGKSGSGKSTLLNLIAGIDRPSAGEVHVAGQAIHAMDERALSPWRGRQVGIVFQFFQLLPTLTIAENVMLPIDFCGTLPVARARDRARELLARVGIADQANKLPAALSGGQQQRAAIARAIGGEPRVILADEPTGNLDTTMSSQIMDLLQAINALGTTILMVTHNNELAQRAQRRVHMVDGKIAIDNALSA